MLCQLKVATHTLGKVTFRPPSRPTRLKTAEGGKEGEGRRTGEEDGKRDSSPRGVLPGRVGRGAGEAGEEPGLAAGSQRTLLPPASRGLV